MSTHQIPTYVFLPGTLYYLSEVRTVEGNYRRATARAQPIHPGMYILELMQDGKSLRKEKIVIQH